MQGFWHHVIRTIKIITFLSVASLVSLDTIIQRKIKLPHECLFLVNVVVKSVLRVDAAVRLGEAKNTNQAICV